MKKQVKDIILIVAAIVTIIGGLAAFLPDSGISTTETNSEDKSQPEPQPEPTPYYENGYVTPVHYESFLNSPFFEIGNNSPNFRLVDFETKLLNTNEVKKLFGGEYNEDKRTDSIKTKSLGKSFRVTNTNAEFLFEPNSNGDLPTHVGIVFTDYVCGEWGKQTGLTFEATGAHGESLGKNAPEPVGFDDQYGETDEDMFFGVVNAEGISSIILSADKESCPVKKYSIEFDHLQYGYFPR